MNTIKILLLKIKQRKNTMDTMNTRQIGYKAKTLDACNLIFYFMIALGLPWISGLLFILGILKFPGGGSKLDFVNIVTIIIYMLQMISPSLAAFVVTAITEGKPGVRALWRRFWNLNLRIKWLLVALLFVPAARLVATLIIRSLNGQTYPIIIPGLTVSMFISSFLTTAMAEEFGWRGYVLPRFQSRWNALTSSIILGVIWASWHYPGIFIPRAYLYQRNVWEFTGWIILCSIIYTWIFNNTNGSVLATCLFHAMVNTAVIWCCTYEAVNPLDLILYGVYLLAIIIIMVFFGPKDLVRRRCGERPEGRHPSEERLAGQRSEENTALSLMGAENPDRRAFP
jgi:uncharacterized protein